MIQSGSFRGIIISAAIAVITLPLFIYLFLYPAFTRLLIESTEQEALRVANHLSSIAIRWGAELRSDFLPPHFAEEAEKLQQDFGLLKIKIFSPDGTILYSTDNKEIGEINRKQYFLDSVSRGNSYAKLVKKNTRSLEGQIIPVDVIETYVPINRSGRFIGAFEIYYDITAKSTKIQRFFTHASGVAFIVTFSLLLLVILSAVKAQKSVLQRNRAEEELRAHKDNLETLVEERTREITEAKQKLEQEIITRRRTEQLIEISKRDWESTFDTIDDVITIHDKDFNIIRANRAVEKMLGIPIHEIIRTKCYFCFHGTGKPPGNCPSCVSLQTGKPTVFEHYEPHFKKYLEIKSIPRFGKDHEIVGLIHIMRDISERKRIEEELIGHREHLTEMVEDRTAELTSAIDLLNDEIASRKQAEEALRMSEKKYRDLYNNSPDMYHSLNVDRIIVDCNETEARMLGYRKEELIGRPLADFFTEKSKNLLQQDYQRLLREKVLRNLERTFVRKDGSMFEAILNVYGDFDESGMLIRIRATARDVSELRHAKAEAMRAAHLASLGELAAGVAHEINNPINGIINYAELIAKKSENHTQQQDIANRIIKEGDRIANIVKSLLSFARDVKEDRKPSSIHTILSDTLTLTEAQLRKDGIQLRIELSPDLYYVLAQPQQIEQVFLNIISNARFALNEKFPRDHPEKVLRISGENRQNSNSPGVRLIFYDSGTGIPDAIKDKIMNPFFSTKPSNIGTGLGLSISLGIIINHDGKIDIESSPGEFTKVIIDLPAYTKDSKR